MSLIEVTEGDYGSEVSVTLYQTDDDTTVESLAGISSVSLDITRLDSTPLVQNAACTIFSSSGGIISFTPASTWFTTAAVDGISHYMAVFKLSFATGQKKTLPVSLYVHLL